jgi:hypothetical protein
MMKCIIAIICFILLPGFSLKKNIPKTCVNCKFFINSFTGDNEYGKCSFFPMLDENDVNYLVTGIKGNIEYHYCSTARKTHDMCGIEGKKYKKKSVKSEFTSIKSINN